MITWSWRQADLGLSRWPGNCISNFAMAMSRITRCRRSSQTRNKLLASSTQPLFNPFCQNRFLNRCGCSAILLRLQGLGACPTKGQSHESNPRLRGSHALACSRRSWATRLRTLKLITHRKHSTGS